MESSRHRNSTGQINYNPSSTSNGISQSRSPLLSRNPARPSRFSLSSRNGGTFQDMKARALELLNKPQILDSEEIKRQAIEMLKSKQPVRDIDVEEIKKRALQMTSTVVQPPLPIPTFQPPVPKPKLKRPVPKPNFQAPLPKPAFQPPAPEPTFQPAPKPTLRVRTDLFCAPQEKKIMKITSDVENELRARNPQVDSHHQTRLSQPGGSGFLQEKSSSKKRVSDVEMAQESKKKKPEGLEVEVRKKKIAPVVEKGSSSEKVVALKKKPKDKAEDAKKKKNDHSGQENNSSLKDITVKKKLEGETRMKKDEHREKDSLSKKDSSVKKKAKRSSSPELEIVSENLTHRRPVINYGPIVLKDEERAKQSKHLIDLNSFPSEPSTSTDQESDEPGPKGYIWPFKSSVAQPSNPNNLKFLGVPIEDQNSDETKSNQRKISGYFSPTKAKNGKVEAQEDLTPEAKSPEKSVSSSPSSKVTPAKKKKSTVSEEETKSTFENLSRFKEILISVTVCKHYQTLINSDDMAVIYAFLQVSEGAKALLVQLSKIKHVWKRINELKHPEIADDLNPVIDELINARFLLKDSELTDLREMMELLKVKEVADLMKVYNLTNGKKKGSNIELILKHCQQQSTIRGNLTHIVEKRVRQVLGRCVKVNMETMDVLKRMCLLESLPLCFQDTSLSDVLYRANMLKWGKLVYPDFEINMERPIFKDRDSLIEFYNAYLLYRDLEREQIAKNIDAVALLCKEAWKSFKTLFEPSKKALRKFDEEMPEFLRRYTAGQTLASAMTTGIDALSKLKEYDSIIYILKDLLAQNCYCRRYRGFWYERLAIINSKYIKNAPEVAETIFKGMDDPLVQTDVKIGLAARATGLRTAKFVSRDVKERLEIYANDAVLSEPPYIIIKGRVKTMDKGAVGQKMNFLMDGDNPDETLVSSVEACAIAHYVKNEGYQKGRHNEGSTIVTLFGLLFWDEIYNLNIPDAFISRYQSEPLDLYGIEFYERRRIALEKKMRKIEKWDTEVSKAHFLQAWEQSVDKTCIVNTKAFENAEEAHSLFECMGAKTVLKICLKLMKDFRNSRRGFPDLVVWNSGKDTKYKFVEVKSPNDTLSNYQKVWIDFLMRNTVPVEVCRVNRVGEKYLSNINELPPASSDSAAGPSSSS